MSYSRLSNNISGHALLPIVPFWLFLYGPVVFADDWPQKEMMVESHDPRLWLVRLAAAFSYSRLSNNPPRVNR